MGLKVGLRIYSLDIFSDRNWEQHNNKKNTETYKRFQQKESFASHTCWNDCAKFAKFRPSWLVTTSKILTFLPRATAMLLAQIWFKPYEAIRLMQNRWQPFVPSIWYFFTVFLDSGNGSEIHSWNEMAWSISWAKKITSLRISSYLKAPKWELRIEHFS